MEKLPRDTTDQPQRRREQPGETVDRYLNILELSKNDIEDKSILDVGCADGGFAIGMKEKNIPATVVSMDMNDSRENFPEDLEYVVADTQQIPLENARFDYVFSVSALPGTAHMNLVTIGKEDKPISYQGFYDLQENERLEYLRQAEHLTEQAIKECLRVTKSGGEMRFGMNNIQQDFGPNNPYKKLREAIDKGVITACQGNATVIELPKPGEKYLYIIKKNPKNEEQKLEPGAN